MCPPLHQPDFWKAEGRRFGCDNYIAQKMTLPYYTLRIQKNPTMDEDAFMLQSLLQVVLEWALGT